MRHEGLWESGYRPTILVLGTRNRDSSVGIATGYRLEGQGSIPCGSKLILFSMASRATLGPTQLLIQWVPGLFPRR
jgi:hypothetical protein